MRVLHTEPTDESPQIILNKEENLFEFSGRSLPADAGEFYSHVKDWFDEYANNPNPKTEVVFKMSYFNTASSKMILDILEKLNDMVVDDRDVVVHWYYEEDDDDMRDAGEEYSEMVEVPFVLSPLEI